MITIMCEKNHQYFFVIIDDGKILYKDKIQDSLWGKPLQYLPQDPNALRQIEMSRNRIPQHFKILLDINEEELAEFEAAKDDDNKLRELIERDLRRNECKIIDIKVE